MPSPKPASLTPERPRPVSLRSIANLAGVHISTVSAVLSPRANSRTRVSEETAERIRNLAARLKYRPSFHAQIMRKRQTGIIGLIEFGRSEIGSTRAHDLTRAVRGHGYYALTTNVLWFDDTPEGSGVDSAIDHVLSARVEGVILVTPTAQLSPSKVYEIQEAGIPCIAFNGVHFPEMPQVRSDVVGGIEALTRHLLERGRRRLALVGDWGRAADENIHWTNQERITGFKLAILAAGGKIVESRSDFAVGSPQNGPLAVLIKEPQRDFFSGAEAGYEAVRALLKGGPLPDALICSNDRYAQGALRACFEAGVRVPGEVAVVGFGGEQDTRFLCPALTTVDTLAPSNALDAVELLLEMIRGERPIKDGTIRKKPCRLMIRESCGFQP